jgi:alkanesulfonate monooxygenase SsuD/methylene tetrahydromethanopterin reductase-like flavin-dependent oxidoreductase (luciferase family)
MEEAMTDLKLGILLWNQATTWPDYLAAAKRLDRLGYDHLWAWDHLYAIFGDPYQPIFEGWTSLAGVAGQTEKIRLGLLVGANTFRNPGLVAKIASTLDHVSGGRAILGLGGAWFELEHEAHGLEFGASPGERLNWLDEAVSAARRVLDGESVKHKVEVLRQHCADVGRDPAAIEMTLGIKATIRDSEAEAVRVWKAAMDHNRTPPARVEGDSTFWNGTAEQLADRLAPYVELGIHTVISEQPAPYDTETLERLIGEVKPLVERGVAARAG